MQKLLRPYTHRCCPPARRHTAGSHSSEMTKQQVLVRMNCKFGSGNIEQKVRWSQEMNWPIS